MAAQGEAGDAGETGEATTVYGITGATGRLGKAVIEDLLARVRPEQIVALVRDPAKAADLRNQGITVRVANYNDPHALTAALRGIDILLFISGSEVGQRMTQHRNVVDAAKRAGVERIAYTSILYADRTANPLAPEHKATEGYIAASGIPYTFLRHGWYTENYLDPARTALKSGTLLTSAGQGRVSSATIADYAAADVAALLHDQGNQVYEMAGDQPWTFDDLAHAISAIGGKPVHVQTVSTADHVAALEASGLPPEAAQFVAALDSTIARGELADTSGTLSRLIGRPSTPLEAGLRQSL